jgi:hypothetical protein
MQRKAQKISGVGDAKASVFPELHDEQANTRCSVYHHHHLPVAINQPPLLVLLFWLVPSFYKFPSTHTVAHHESVWSDVLNMNDHS